MMQMKPRMPGSMVPGKTSSSTATKMMPTMKTAMANVVSWPTRLPAT